MELIQTSMHTTVIPTIFTVPPIAPLNAHA